MQLRYRVLNVSVLNYPSSSTQKNVTLLFRKNLLNFPFKCPQKTNFIIVVEQIENVSGMYSPRLQRVSQHCANFYRAGGDLKGSCSRKNG